MKNARFLLAPVLWAAATFPALAAPIPLAELSAWLNDLNSVRGDFTQANGDGTVSTGAFFLKRPGRARFEYAPPDDTLVIAGGGQVAIFDGRSNTGPEQYPLSRTPLSIILARNVNLSQSGMVVDHREDSGRTIVTAQDPEHPEYGSLRLVFTADPVRLHGWIVTDGGGGQTAVTIGNVERGVRLSDNKFSIVLETMAREQQGR